MWLRLRSFGRYSTVRGGLGHLPGQSNFACVSYSRYGKLKVLKGAIKKRLSEGAVRAGYLPIHADDHPRISWSCHAMPLHLTRAWFSFSSLCSQWMSSTEAKVIIHSPDNSSIFRFFDWTLRQSTSLRLTPDRIPLVPCATATAASRDSGLQYNTSRPAQSPNHQNTTKNNQRLIRLPYRVSASISSRQRLLATSAFATQVFDPPRVQFDGYIATSKCEEEP